MHGAEEKHYEGKLVKANKIFLLKGLTLKYEICQKCQLSLGKSCRFLVWFKTGRKVMSDEHGGGSKLILWYVK